jgi:hypothetical protein
MKVFVWIHHRYHWKLFSYEHRVKILHGLTLLAVDISCTFDVLLNVEAEPPSSAMPKLGFSQSTWKVVPSINQVKRKSFSEV